jgi:hypothetical protein
MDVDVDVDGLVDKCTRERERKRSVLGLLRFGESQARRGEGSAAASTCAEERLRGVSGVGAHSTGSIYPPKAGLPQSTGMREGHGI